MKRVLSSSSSANSSPKRSRTECHTAGEVTCIDPYDPYDPYDALRARISALEEENAELRAAAANARDESLDERVMRGVPRDVLIGFVSARDERAILALGAGVASAALSRASAARETPGALLIELHGAFMDNPIVGYHMLMVDVYNDASTQLLGSVRLQITPTQARTRGAFNTADWQDITPVDVSHTALRGILDAATDVWAQKSVDPYDILALGPIALRPTAWDVASRFELTDGQRVRVYVDLQRSDARDIAVVRDALLHVGVDLRQHDAEN